jgi:hypothetical protein
MEIVLAILLLFGGFTLGSITSEKGGDELQSSMDLPNVADATNLHSVTQAKSWSDLAECHSDGAVIYRDLTIPYSGQAGGCEGKCSDE